MTSESQTRELTQNKDDKFFCPNSRPVSVLTSCIVYLYSSWETVKLLPQITRIQLTQSAVFDKLSANSGVLSIVNTSTVSRDAVVLNTVQISNTSW